MVGFTYAEVMGVVNSVIRVISYSAVSLIVVIGIWYYFFIYRKRKVWYCDIYEQKADGYLHLVGKDILREKKVNLGKQTIYTFKRRRAEAMPPSWESVHRLGGKEYCAYLRVAEDYIPVSKIMPDGINLIKDTELKKTVVHGIKEQLKKLHSIKTTLFSAGEVENKFVYIPLHEAVKYTIQVKTIPYDLNMMRINQLDNINQIFKDKQDFWQKYGAMVIIGIGVVMVIVVAYLSFQYMNGVVDKSLGAADSVAKPLNAIVDKLTGK